MVSCRFPVHRWWMSQRLVRYQVAWPVWRDSLKARSLRLRLPNPLSPRFISNRDLSRYVLIMIVSHTPIPPPWPAWYRVAPGQTWQIKYISTWFLTVSWFLSWNLSSNNQARNIKGGECYTTVPPRRNLSSLMCFAQAFRQLLWFSAKREASGKVGKLTVSASHCKEKFNKY